jgi:hypothetical protein
MDRRLFLKRIGGIMGLAYIAPLELIPPVVNYENYFL